MRRLGLIMSGYLIRTIIPYFIFSWLLLSVILFVQQAGRFSDIFFSVNIPATFVWQLMIALIPSVIAFTCPMAVLVGTVIGLAKMQGDSELVAMRAAGIGNVQITLPIILLGSVLSAFAFAVNLEGVPLAVRLVRQVALKTAIQKLESPIEPGIFNTELPGYTIFVNSGDAENGRWQNIFVYQENAGAGTARYITSASGRIDVSDQISELVLENATVTTLPLPGSEGKYVTEGLGDIRIAIKTRRNELIERLSSVQMSPEELGLTQLSEYAATKEGKDRIEAQILWQRRILLSITPLIFCLLGAAMILRARRGGRGYGTVLALLGLIVYYLVAFLGEQLARVGAISVFTAGAIPVVSALLFVLWLNLSRKYELFGRIAEQVRATWTSVYHSSNRIQIRDVFVDLTTGLRDLDILTSLLKHFVLTLAFVGTLSVIFTAFELWRFAGAMEGGVVLLTRYLIFLLPFIYMQYLAPTAVMLAILATYVIKSRQNEVVTWISAGLSVYRLLLPCLLAAAILGLVNWQVQERVLPSTNRIQDDLRTLIRSKGALVRGNGRYWLYDDNRIITYRISTSDNEKRDAPDSLRRNPASDNEKKLSSVAVVQLSQEDWNLQHLYRSSSSDWTHGTLHLEGPVDHNMIANGAIFREVLPSADFEIASDPFMGTVERPSHLSRIQLQRRFNESDSETEKRIYGVALQRRYSTPFLPIVIAMFSAPFALTLGRRGRVTTVGAAIGIWLLFIGMTSVFEQFGVNGSLSPELSVWSPMAIFGAIGLLLLARIRT